MSKLGVDSVNAGGVSGKLDELLRSASSDAHAWLLASGEETETPAGVLVSALPADKDDDDDEADTERVLVVLAEDVVLRALGCTLR